jgi:hypothetical protein
VKENLSTTTVQEVLTETTVVVETMVVEIEKDINYSFL